MKNKIKLLAFVSALLVTVTGCVSLQQTTQITEQEVVKAGEPATTESAEQKLQEEMPAESEEHSVDYSQTVFGEFEAQTIGDSTFTQADLESYDLTMLYVWATWCPACIAGMPDLAALDTQLPDNVNLISYGSDADIERSTTENILESNGVTFDTLIADDALNESLAPYIQVFPTILFLDGDGNFITMAQGTPASDEVNTYLALIDDLLAEHT